MNLPNFLCIGAQKAGTSWLFANMLQHPSVWMPPIKELHYFNHLFVPQNRNWTLSHIRRGAAEAIRWHAKNSDNTDFSYVKYLAELVTDDPFTEKWYRRLFDRPAANRKVCGDITPEYSTIPEAGIRYVRSLLGAVKIIYIIRDPVDRALSQLRMNIERSNSSPTSSADWSDRAAAWDIYNRGDYADFIPKWKANFCDKDILFLPYRRIASDPSGLIRDIESFLNLQPFSGYTALHKTIHETKKISIPSEVTQKYRNDFAAQTEFLKKEFGEDFVAAL